MKRSFTIATHHITSPITFVAMFQLWMTILSTGITSFPALLTLSTAAALGIAFWSNRISTPFIITLQQVVVISSIAIISSLLFIFRLGWHIFDYICPTGVLGLVTQISQGQFPASFLSFPDFPMNYHQGFLITAGTLSYITNLSPGTSIIVTSTAAYATLIVGVSLLLVFLKNHYYYVPALLFIGVTSIHAKYITGIDFGWYNYVSVFEYMGSNSWPITLITLTALLFFATQYQHTLTHITFGGLLILAFATTNATVFSVCILTIPLIYIYHCYATNHWHRTYFVFSATLFFFIIVVPTLIPSALLQGINYQSPGYVIRVFDSGIERYLKHVARYILLCGPIVIASFAAAYTIYNTKTNTLDWRTWPVGMFLVSWTFPLLFGFSNVDMWDNFHKFVILNIFLSIIILLLFYKESVIRGKRLVVFMLLCLICSVPALADMTKNRFSSNITHHITPAPSITDIVFYLQQQPRHLIPYKNDISGLCDETGYSAIAQHANVPLAQSYFTNFLISAELETALTEALTWTDTKADRVATIQSLAPDHAIVIAKKHEIEFIDALNTIPVLERRNLTYFSDYILYE